MKSRANLFVLLALLCALFAPGGAQAQAPGVYDCHFVLGADLKLSGQCVLIEPEEPQPTETPTATATEAATETPEPPAPTATATQPPAPTKTPAPVAGLRVNVPLLSANPGDALLDANNRTGVWLGEMSPNGGHTQVRLVGSNAGVHVLIQTFRKEIAGQVVLGINGQSYPATYPSSPGWSFSYRLNRGWTAERVIPWSELGGKPLEGMEWPFGVRAFGSEWVGTLHWGLPDYNGQQVAGAQTVQVPLAADAVLGGSTDCGASAGPDYFPTWGDLNWGSSSYLIAQNQWDTADWPCYAKVLGAFNFSLPEGAQVVSATVTLRHFGNPGYGPGYASDGTGDTVFEVYEVDQPWQEATVSWDSAPRPVENISRTKVLPIDITCGGSRYCNPGIPYSFDVTEIVKRAQADGRGWASFALYTWAGQYHSGKQFWSREGGDQAPIVRISYVMEGEEPAWTPTAVSTATPEPPPAKTTATAIPATSTPELPPPSATPSPLPPTATPTSTPTSTAAPTPGGIGCTRSIGPSDNLPAALSVLQPGQTLCLRDGVYAQAFVPTRDGTAAAPITVKALNDGKATIDGQGVRKTVDLQRSFWVIEGIVARNGTDNVFRVDGSNNVLRRVSAYDASTDINSSVIMLLGANNLVEDALVAGTGRYMAEVYKGSGNTLRRVFTMWAGWDGRQFCGVAWPNGNNVGVYNASNTTVENVIAYGRSLKGVMVQANSNTAVADNNQVLGSIAVLQGRNYDGSVWNYGSYPTRPGPTSCTSVDELGAGGDRVGFILFGQGTITNNVFRDVLAVDNVGAGFDAHRPYTAGAVGGNVLERATLIGNGAQLPSNQRGQGGNMYISLPGVEVLDSRIPNAPAQLVQGQGAILQQYVDRQATGQPMTPWPMEDRAVAEMGLSIESIIQEYAAR